MPSVVRVMWRVYPQWKDEKSIHYSVRHDQGQFSHHGTKPMQILIYIYTMTEFSNASTLLTRAKVPRQLLSFGIDIAYAHHHAHPYGLVPEDVAMCEPQTAVCQGHTQNDMPHAGDECRVFEEVVKGHARVGVMLGLGVERVVGALLTSAALVS